MPECFIQVSPVAVVNLLSCHYYHYRVWLLDVWTRYSLSFRTGGGQNPILVLAFCGPMKICKLSSHQETRVGCVLFSHMCKSWRLRFLPYGYSYTLFFTTSHFIIQTLWLKNKLEQVVYIFLADKWVLSQSLIFKVYLVHISFQTLK
jgi:hypothetical protein